MEYIVVRTRDLGSPRTPTASPRRRAEPKLAAIEAATAPRRHHDDPNGRVANTARTGYRTGINAFVAFGIACGCRAEAMGLIVMEGM